MSWFTAALFLFGVASAIACRGFDMIVSKEKNCGGPDQIIKITKRSCEINNKCEVISSSCTSLRPYKSAMMTMNIFDGAMQVYQTSYDLCSKKAQSDMVMSNIVGWGIPPSCPILENSEFCYNGSRIATLPVPVQNMLQVFSLTKSVKIRIVITHDTGKSCFEGESKVVKKVN